MTESHGHFSISLSCWALKLLASRSNPELRFHNVCTWIVSNICISDLQNQRYDVYYFLGFAVFELQYLPYWIMYWYAYNQIAHYMYLLYINSETLIHMCNLKCALIIDVYNLFLNAEKLFICMMTQLRVVWNAELVASWQHAHYDIYWLRIEGSVCKRAKNKLCSIFLFNFLGFDWCVKIMSYGRFEYRYIELP